MYYPCLDDVKELAKAYNRIPVYKEMDLSQPGCLILLKSLQKQHDVIFLESSDRTENRQGRFTYLGFNPRKKYLFQPPRVIEQKDHTENPLAEDFFEFLKTVVDSYHSPTYRQFGDFNGGLAGYFGFELINHTGILRRPIKESGHIPLANLLFIDDFICYDNQEKKYFLSVPLYTHEAADIDTQYQQVIQKLNELEQEVLGEIQQTAVSYLPSFTKEFILNFRESQNSYMDKVTRVKELIDSGEAIQVVLSMRADVPRDIDPYKFYLHLRKLNPSPYMFFFKSGSLVITGSSPEIHVKMLGRRVIIKPIAGTISRDNDPLKNSVNKNQLLNDPKERAEHLMLVDLARNDLARIAEPGSVQVTQFMQPEDYSHVIHLVSTVEARLSPLKHPVDVLRETFPAGTVSGAPKVRALEIIDEMEDFPRDIYAGAFGYVGFNGNMDTCISIRTACFTPQGNYVQAGSGIVQDSVPQQEYQEICNKLKALAISLPYARV